MIRDIPIALPTLVTPALAVDFNNEVHANLVRKMAEDLRDTVQYKKAYGCAANQAQWENWNNQTLHDSLRVICVGTHIYVNPSWAPEFGATHTPIKEGCLSFPGLFVPVSRPDKIVIQYQDVNGQNHTGHLNGIDAICFQHEVDHLNGKVFFRDASTLVLKRAITAAEKNGYQYTLKQLRFFIEK